MTAQVQLVRKFGLTHGEAIILVQMAEGKVLSRDEIKERCLPSKFVCDQAVSTHIYRINKAIAPLKISNVRAKGYMLEGENLEAVRAVIGGGQ